MVESGLRFRTAAPHYLIGRPPYPARLIRRFVELCALGKTHRVMDLGCGPAQLAVALAPFVGEVVALDPEPAMLKAAAENIARAKVAVRLVEGSSHDLGPALGRFQAVVMGRSFHWMDRPRTLERLDALIEPAGAVALFHDSHPDLPDNAWRAPLRELLRRYAGEDSGQPHRSPGWLPHEAVLLDSPFHRLERISVIERRETPVETFVHRAFSMSSTAPARLGDRAEAMAEEIRQLMQSYATDGTVAEVLETKALIARR